MNKMLRRKKRVRPYPPEKRKPSRPAKGAWKRQVSDRDRYWASVDARQLAFAFHPAPVFSGRGQRSARIRQLRT
jgi:hypothetical protein